ncbi:MAG: hypothetical protein JW779_09595 [Candidatus Thorarchaeota archaeon]|nr:hypothetical protein [Candidatus Thorarchaeota archaeon]
MSTGNSKAIVVTTIIIIGISGAVFPSLYNLANPVITPNLLGISEMRICGNSTDLLYPDLAEADFVLLDNGNWQVDADFLNDSLDFEYLESYSHFFEVTEEEIRSITNALYYGLNQTRSSEIMAIALLESSPSDWYDVKLTYTNVSWVYITAFQTEPGYIIYNSGTATLNTNLLDGTVIEPLSALDFLVTAIYTIFSNHMV